MEWWTLWASTNFELTESPIQLNDSVVHSGESKFSFRHWLAHALVWTVTVQKSLGHSGWDVRDTYFRDSLFFQRVVLIFTIQSFQNFLRGQISRAWSVKGNTQQYTDALTTLLSTFFQNCSSVKFIAKALFSPLRISKYLCTPTTATMPRNWKKMEKVWHLFHSFVVTHDGVVHLYLRSL